MTPQEIIGKEQVSRGEAIKILWAYIKERDLQNPANKQYILAKNDPKLHALLGVDECRGFAMSKHLKPHFLTGKPSAADKEEEEASASDDSD